MESLQLRLLGTIEAERGGEPVVLPGRKTQALLVYLTAQARPYSRSELHDLFCADAEDPPAALRWHLSRLRRALGTEAIITEEDTVRFNLSACHVDCDEFEQILDANLVGQEMGT